MSVIRFPVVLWGGPPWTAVLVEEPSLATLGGTREECLQDLKEWLRHCYDEASELSELKPHRPDLSWVKVELRPEYPLRETRGWLRGSQPQNRSFQVEDSLTLRLPCLSGEWEGGLGRCVLPTLQVQFYYEPSRDLKELVRHYTHEKLSGLTPSQLARWLPPAQVELANISLKSGTRLKAQTKDEDGPLSEVSHRLLPGSSGRPFGREREVEELAARLRQGSSLLLVGATGSGKSMLLAECARQLKRDGISIWSTSGPRLIAGMAYLGQWEQRTQAVIQQLQRQKGILLAENLQDLVRLGGSEPGGSVASFLMGFVERADLQLVVECTAEEWSACRQLLPGFVELLEVFRVEEFTPSQALDVLQKVLLAAQQRRRLQLGSGMAETLYHLFARFMPYLAFPGACCRFVLAWLARQPEGSCLDRAQLVEAFSRETGLPERFLRDEIVLHPDQIRSELESSVMGQPQAVEVVTRLLATFKTGLHDPERPLGVLLFCGPTGVGKTEMARSLARFLFGDKNRLIRLDMSEFASPGSAERLVGSVFSESPSLLIQQLRAQPFSVLLLDEIEKADAEVFDVLLRVLDEGVLTDPLGRRVSCQSSIVIMTSNLGSEQLRSVGFKKSAGPNYESVALSFFRPEFVNRFDSIVSFQPLQFEHIRQIAARELKLLEERPGLKRAQLSLKVRDALLDWLARTGYDPNSGARPLQRLIEQRVVPVLAPFCQKKIRGSLELDWDGQQIRVVLPDRRLG